jgi:hypothetical protein
MAGTTPLGTTVTIDSTAYADVLDVSYSPGSVELIDTTDLSDTTRTKIAGFVDIGSVSVTFNWSKTEYASILADADGSAKAIVVTFSDTSTWAGNGVLDVPGFSITPGSGVSGTVNIQQTEAWTFTAAV